LVEADAAVDLALAPGAHIAERLAWRMPREALSHVPRPSQVPSPFAGIGYSAAASAARCSANVPTGGRE